tara:strand:+ start:384 stop:2408 length:2025 start_codon:yes stop_codon:yes gene_type:complete
MQFSENWLKEFIDINISTEELCEQLTMLGLEVDGYEKYKSKITGDDSIIKLDITPNRGDCFSILGIARELSALNGLKIKLPAEEKINETIESPIDVDICNESPRYVGRYVEGVDLKKKVSPLIIERLKLSDVRSIDPIVDITNYVLLETGQPLHAFDAKKIPNGLGVRLAKDKEEIELLDEQTLKLSRDCLVITDKSDPVALAGIMGGLDSGISSSTKSIYLESAFFKPEIIRGKARRYGLQTDASVRFERGVDYQLQSLAIERASQLIMNFMDCDFAPIQTFEIKKSIPKEKKISLDIQNVRKSLGVNIKDSEVKRILKSLGMKIELTKSDGKVLVSIPSWRFDISIEVDLVEEVARLIGYDKLPSSSLRSSNRKTVDSLNHNVISSLVSLGYNEVITYSFVDEKEALLFEEKDKMLFVQNPISQNMSVMRTSLLPGLLNTFSYNFNRGEESVKLFEIGSTFLKGKKITQKEKLAGLVSGKVSDIHWCDENRAFDFFDIKGDLEVLLNQDYSFTNGKLPFLHPGKTALITFKNKEIGFVGALSPNISNSLDLKQDIYYFELNLDSLPQPHVRKYSKYSKFPIAQRDLAFLVDKQLPVSFILELAKKKAGKNLKEINLFDVYQGKGIPENKKSIAFSLFWQSMKGTLTDEEVDLIVEDISKYLSKEVKAELRSE